MLIIIRDESPLVYRVPDASEDSKFDCSTALFQVTMYRQFARKVGTSANSALNSLLFTAFKTVKLDSR